MTSDARVRLHILTELLERGVAPGAPDAAAALGIPEADAIAAYDRLAAGRVIVLRPGTRDVMMAAPLSAVPTPHIVRLAGGPARYGNCVWDAMGVLAMTARDGDVDTTCEDCGSALRLTVRNGELEPTDAVVHFAVPASRWWEDIFFT